jgi:hypothetical protein
VSVQEVLRLLWGDSYLFGYDQGWWAIRDGRLGSLLTAVAPEELGRPLGEAEGTGR